MTKVLAKTKNISLKREALVIAVTKVLSIAPSVSQKSALYFCKGAHVSAEEAQAYIFREQDAQRPSCLAVTRSNLF